MFIDSKISKISPAAGCIENTYQFISNNTPFNENSCRTTFGDFIFQVYFQGFLSGVFSGVFTPEPRIRKKRSVVDCGTSKQNLRRGGLWIVTTPEGLR